MNRIKNLISKNLYNRGILQLLILLVILFLYLYFPNNNSSWDGYVYAAQVKYNVDMFQPHHLLYNPLLKIFHEFFSIFSDQIDILLAGKWMNAIFQGFNLLIAAQILRLLKVSQKDIFLLIAIIAFSFNPWRFGTENEAYIVPITFSMLGTWAFLKYLNVNNVKWLMLTSLFAAVACLFHQIHFFWWLGLGMGSFINTRNIKTFIQFSIPALIVPITYTYINSVIFNQPLTIESLMNFILRDVNSGAFKTEFGLKTIFLQLVSSVRTFIQLHPIILLLIKQKFIFILPLVISLGVMAFGIKYYFKNKVFSRTELSKSSTYKVFFLTHTLILIMHYLFAFYNIGNVEFMVMIPFLVIFILVSRYVIDTKFLYSITFFLFIWNFSFGILPYNKYTFTKDDKLVEFIQNYPENTYVVKSRIIEAKYFYVTGIDTPDYIKLAEKYTIQELNTFAATDTIYTDMIDYPIIFNKESLFDNHKEQEPFEDCQMQVIMTYKGIFGKSTIYKVYK